MILPINSAKNVYFAGKNSKTQVPEKTTEENKEKAKELPYSEDTLLKKQLFNQNSYRI